MKGPFVATLVVVLFMIGQLAYAQNLSADPAGSARGIAENELKKLPFHFSTVPGHSPFGVANRSVLENATLGEPFRYYWPDSTFFRFENAEPSALLQFLRNMCVCFPVHSGGQVLGTINIQLHDDGSLSVTRFVGDKLVVWHADLARSAPLVLGRRVSVVATIAGEFAVVEDGTTVFAVARLDGQPLEPTASAQDVGPKWLPPSRVAPVVKSALRAAREAMSNAEKPEESKPLPELDDDR